jgi:hypothetical protein
MKRLWLIPILLAALVVPAVVLAASGEGFDGVVRSIENRYHVRATRIPFLGLVSLIARKATNNGVGNLHVAEFESFSGPVDGEELNRMVEQKLGSGWERIIRETSRQGKEQTLIFMRSEGERMGLFVVDLDGKEMNVVQVSVDPDHLNENLGRYEHHPHHDSGRDAGEDAGDESD